MHLRESFAPPQVDRSSFRYEPEDFVPICEPCFHAAVGEFIAAFDFPAPPVSAPDAT